jgi:hypothetical protein
MAPFLYEKIPLTDYHVGNPSTGFSVEPQKPRRNAGVILLTKQVLSVVHYCCSVDASLGRGERHELNERWSSA